MENGAILIKVHQLYYPYVRNCRNLVMHVNLENAHNKTTSQCYSDLRHQSNVALLLPFYNPFVTRFWMLHVCCFSPCRCKDASPKGGYRRAMPMLQIFHVCDDDPPKTSRFVALKKPSQRSTKARNGWELVAFWCELNHGIKLQGGKLL